MNNTDDGWLPMDKLPKNSAPVIMRNEWGDKVIAHEVANITEYYAVYLPGTCMLQPRLAWKPVAWRPVP